MNVLSDAKVRGGPVSHVGTIGAPDAGILDGNTLVVDVVLGACRQPAPCEIVVGIRASQRTSAVRLSIQRDNLIFRS